METRLSLECAQYLKMRPTTDNQADSWHIDPSRLFFVVSYRITVGDTGIKT
jgi:hypothetical protein